MAREIKFRAWNKKQKWLHESEEELKEGIRKRFNLLRAEVEKEFGEIQK